MIEQVTSGNGYNFDLRGADNVFAPYSRNSLKKNPNLLCNNNDKFTVNTDKGNGDLKYPIALLTVDEAALAGGKSGVMNYNYYLWTGQTYWTMSPAYFILYNAYSTLHAVYSTGLLSSFGPTSTYGVRPVLNLSSDVLYSSGTGTEEDPYIVKLP